MTRTLTLAVITLLSIFMLGGCPNGRSVRVVVQPPEAPIPSSLEDMKKELVAVRARARLLEGSIEDAKIDALQTKIWIGVGLCTLAGLVLIAVGIWTTRRILVEVGIGVLGLAALGTLAAWLVPYILWIGVGVAVIVIGFVIFMLANREKALKQVSDAVNDAKDTIPEFKLGYKRIFQSHIDTAMDRVIDSVRGVKS